MKRLREFYFEYFHFHLLTFSLVRPGVKMGKQWKMLQDPHGFGIFSFFPPHSLFLRV